MVVKNKERKNYSKSMESPISEGDRVLYLGNTKTKGSIGTVQKIAKEGLVSVSFESNCCMYVQEKTIHHINADESIPDGTRLDDCIIRPFRNHYGSYMPDRAIGQALAISNYWASCVEVDLSKETWDKYYIRHDCYYIVPNYKNAWVLENSKLHYKTLAFHHFDGCFIKWQDDNGVYITDSIVENEITDALDMARKFTKEHLIEVVR